MLAKSAVLAAKDLRLVLAGGQGLVQTVLLGLLVIFVFSLAKAPGEMVPAQGVSAVFWLASAFGQVLIFNALFSLEDDGDARLGLIMAPMPLQAIWLGKALAGLVLLVIAQAVFAPASAVFLGRGIQGGWFYALVLVAAVDVGLVVLGALLGALARGQSAKESLLTVILFPLLIPLLLAGIRIGGMLVQGEDMSGALEWFGLAGAFDAIFTGAALVLFPFVYGSED